MSIYKLPSLTSLLRRLKEPRRFIQIILGPRQVGKTTLIRQAETTGLKPFVYVSADEAAPRDPAWIDTHWQRARLNARHGKAVVLVIDEVQKVPGWSEAVKANWDTDTANETNVKVVLLGSSPLFAARGITESLAGRYEILHVPHWTFSEMRAAFSYSLHDYLFFGGYPGAASLKDDEPRWRQYVRESIIEATVGRDLLTSVRVDKPALLRQLFYLTCEYGAQVLSFTKMLGQLQDAGNTTTLAHYLELLSQSGLATGIQKFSREKARVRASSPKLLVLDTSLMTAILGESSEEIFSNPDRKGRLIETAVGAHLWKAVGQGHCNLCYWSEGTMEVDYVLVAGQRVLAIEVKSGRRSRAVPALPEFQKRNPKSRSLIVGTGGMPLEEFLTIDPNSLIKHLM